MEREWDKGRGGGGMKLSGEENLGAAGTGVKLGVMFLLGDTEWRGGTGLERDVSPFINV